MEVGLWIFYIHHKYPHEQFYYINSEVLQCAAHLFEGSQECLMYIQSPICFHRRDVGISTSFLTANCFLFINKFLKYCCSIPAHPLFISIRKKSAPYMKAI